MRKGKGKYKAIPVRDFEISDLGDRIILAVDVAKQGFFAAIMDPVQRVLSTVKWQHPRETPEFIGLVARLRAAGVDVEAAMEPSGVYGDAVRALLLDAGVPVYRVSPKRVHDAAEVYDGVPSLHDAKAAAIVGKLHLDGASELWPLASEGERGLTAALRVLEIHQKEVQRNRNRLEGVLARHWPELPSILELGSASLLELLILFGCPVAVAADLETAERLLQQVGGHFLDQGKIDAVLASAKTTLGLRPLEQETQLIRTISRETRRQGQAAAAARREVEKLCLATGATREMAPVIGKTTAAVLVAGVGDARRYSSAAAYQKALGLNLKEKSSGKHVGALHITKRGPGIARFFLYMAVLRLIQTDVVARAWYASKVNRDGGTKQKALVALMRKLSRALWHVAQGCEFDSTLLFDVKRLRIDTPAPEGGARRRLRSRPPRHAPDGSEAAVIVEPALTA